ncbi:MAG: DUF5110 domain-containing protein, partial [Halanaerobiales bacterium]
TFYNDEGDNYNYERGYYELFKIKWDDENKLLIFSDRSGKGYREMINDINFNLVLVNSLKGIGIHEIDNPDKKIVYQGKALSCQL